MDTTVRIPPIPVLPGTCEHWRTPLYHCLTPARYYIGWLDPDGTARWGYVCGNCDNRLGTDNLARNLHIGHQEAWLLNRRLIRDGHQQGLDRHEESG